jgi:hypothetical protein
MILDEFILAGKSFGWMCYRSMFALCRWRTQYRSFLCFLATGEIEETSKKTILDRIKLLEKLE